MGRKAMDPAVRPVVATFRLPPDVIALLREFGTAWLVEQARREERRRARARVSAGN